MEAFLTLMRARDHADLLFYAVELGHTSISFAVFGSKRIDLAHPYTFIQACIDRALRELNTGVLINQGLVTGNSSHDPCFALPRSYLPGHRVVLNIPQAILDMRGVTNIPKSILEMGDVSELMAALQPIQFEDLQKKVHLTIHHGFADLLPADLIEIVVLFAGMSPWVF